MPDTGNLDADPGPRAPGQPMTTAARRGALTPTTVLLALEERSEADVEDGLAAQFAADGERARTRARARVLDDIATVGEVLEVAARLDRDTLGRLMGTARVLGATHQEIADQLGVRDMIANGRLQRWRRREPGHKVAVALAAAEEAGLVRNNPRAWGRQR